MSTVRHRAAILAASLVLVSIALPRAGLPVRADDPDVNGAIAQQQRMEQQLAEQRVRLASLVRSQADLGASLQQLTANISTVGVAIQDAEARLTALAAGLDRARSELADYRAQIVNLSADLEQIAGQIDATRIDLAQREALLEDHLRTTYEESQVSILEVILSSQSFGQAASQLTDLMTLSDDDRLLADGIRTTRRQLEVRQATLRDGRQTLSDLEASSVARAQALDAEQKALDAARAALEAKKAQLVELQKAQQSQLAAAIRGADAYRQRIAAQEAALAGQDALVARLKDEADKLDIAYRGRFDWPERGQFIVTQEFGPTQYEYFHSGIDIAYLTPTCGGAIYAAADGVVLADGRPNLDYGDTAIGVILGHSQRLQTWYWHLSREVVDVGQEVKVGDVIGYEGATGWATGCHLHFQVMFDGQPVNPRNYLP